MVTLKLGAIKAPRHESGLVLSLDWLPQKPHDVMAVGFYDGTSAGGRRHRVMVPSFWVS